MTNINVGDCVEWVKRTQCGREIEFRLMRDTAVEVRPEFVVVRTKNGRRKRLAVGLITAVNGVPVQQAPADSPAEGEVGEVNDGN